MGSKGIEAGKAFVKFLIDDKQLDSDLVRVGQKLRKVGTIGLAATLPILAALGSFAMLAADVGGELTDMAARTSMSVEMLTELRFAAEQTGASLESIEKAAKFMQKQGLDPRKFQEVAEGIAAIEDPTARAQAAMKKFGKGGTTLLPMIENLAEMRQQARELGLVMSTKDAAAADDLGDAVDVAKSQIKALGVSIGVAIAGPLTDFLKWSQSAIASVIGFVREHPQLVAAFAAATTAIAAASAALVVLGTIMTIITFHPIIAAIALISGAIVGLATYFGFANKGATEFKNNLDGLKKSGRDVGRQLDKSLSKRRDLGTPPLAKTRSAAGVLTGTRTRIMPSVSTAAAAEANRQSGTIDDVIKWVKQTAENTDRLVRIGRTTPLGFLAGFG